MADTDLNMPGAGDADKAAPGARTSLLLRRATVASVAVAATLVSIKAVAWIVTGSVAMLSSAVDSLLDVVASLIIFFAVRHALMPADAEHRFGHGKAEAVAGLAQSAVIAGSAVFLLFESGERLIHPSIVVNSPAGIAVMVFSMTLTLALVLYQRYVVRITKSVAVNADSLHFKSDILMNSAVILALVLSANFGFERADPIFALAIALFIAWSAWRIWAQSIDMVMDRELPEDERKTIREIVRSHAAIIDMHDLRTRSSGTHTFIQFHIEVSSDCSLKRAHDISDDIEAKLAETFPDAEILIHADPFGIQEPRADFGRE